MPCDDETTYIVQTTTFQCKIVVSSEHYIRWSEPSLKRFIGSKLDTLKKWLYSIDQAYKIHEQSELFTKQQRQAWPEELEPL